MENYVDLFQSLEDRIVYVKPVNVDELPDDIRSQMTDEKMLYAVHSSNGERIALVKERNIAFTLARQNDLSPVTVH